MVGSMLGYLNSHESRGISGYDVGKKIKGRKRHIVTDPLGLLLMFHVHVVSIQDRDGAVDLFKALGKNFRICVISSPMAGIGVRS